MTSVFGKIQLEKVTTRWCEAQMLWPKTWEFQGEDEALVLNFFIVWRFIPGIKDWDALLWNQMTNNLPEIINKWLMLDTNSLYATVGYHTITMLAIIIDKVWRSNFNATILRHYRPVLQKAARDIEMYSPGGFRKMVGTRIIQQPTQIRRQGLLRKTVEKFYAIKVVILTKFEATAEELEDFIGLTYQIRSQVNTIIKQECFYLS